MCDIYLYVTFHSYMPYICVQVKLELSSGLNIFLRFQICKCFPFGEAEEEPSLRNNRSRIKIDRSMIGNPTDFRHTVHGTGGGNLQVCMQWLIGI